MSTETTKAVPFLSELERYDPISHDYTGSWSFDRQAIKACKDGDFVLFEDVEAELSRLRQQVEEARVALEDLVNDLDSPGDIKDPSEYLKHPMEQARETLAKLPKPPQP